MVDSQGLSSPPFSVRVYVERLVAYRYVEKLSALETHIALYRTEQGPQLAVCLISRREGKHVFARHSYCVADYPSFWAPAACDRCELRTCHSFFACTHMACREDKKPQSLSIR